MLSIVRLRAGLAQSGQTVGAANRAVMAGTIAQTARLAQTKKFYGQLACKVYLNHADTHFCWHIAPVNASSQRPTPAGDDL